MKIFKRILIGLLVLLIILQFFRPEKNITVKAQPNAISRHYAIPSNVQTILSKACNDCHSNNTNYPWYSNIQPVAWWLADHVKEGKRKLNFDEFASYRLRRQYHKLEETEELVENGAMPIESYTLVHKAAKLTSDEKQVLLNWSQGVRETMRARYPIDSLVAKKK